MWAVLQTPQLLRSDGSIRWVNSAFAATGCSPRPLLFATLAKLFHVWLMNPILFLAAQTGRVTPAMVTPDGEVQLTLPRVLPSPCASDAHTGLHAAMGLDTAIPFACSQGGEYVVLEVPDLGPVLQVLCTSPPSGVYPQIVLCNVVVCCAQARPSFTALSSLIAPKAGVIVTARSPAETTDFVSRVFFPDELAEDAVCAGAHQLLASYWTVKLNKTSLRGYQASRRGGMVGMTILNTTHVMLSGPSVLVSTITLSHSLFS